jgi:release factor glutamine methyltransferase
LFQHTFPTRITNIFNRLKVSYFFVFSNKVIPRKGVAMLNNYELLIIETAKQLAQPHNPEMIHTQEATWLVQHVMRKNSFNPYHMVDIAEPNKKQLDLLASLIRRRTQDHEPLAYILENVPFCTLELNTRPPILIPRLETEEWCQELIEKLQPHQQKTLKILDLCTGSGCLALALANAMPNSQVIGIDINPEAIALAQQNANLNAICNATFVEVDLFTTLPLNHDIDLIVANPPYISDADWQQLTPDVKNWEDKQALVAANTGLAFYPRIAALSAQLLTKKNGLGQCIVEIGTEQASAISRILTQHQLEVDLIWQDSFQKNRAIFASKT